MARFFVIKPTMTKPGATLMWAAYPRLMVKVLLEEVQRLAIPMLTSATVIKLPHQCDENGEDRVAGAILATGHRAHNPWG